MFAAGCPFTATTNDVHLNAEGKRRLPNQFGGNILDDGYAYLLK